MTDRQLARALRRFQRKARRRLCYHCIVAMERFCFNDVYTHLGAMYESEYSWLYEQHASRHPYSGRHLEVAQ